MKSLDCVVVRVVFAVVLADSVAVASEEQAAAVSDVPMAVASEVADVEAADVEGAEEGASDGSELLALEVVEQHLDDLLAREAEAQREGEARIVAIGEAIERRRQALFERRAAALPDEASADQYRLLVKDFERMTTIRRNLKRAMVKNSMFGGADSARERDALYAKLTARIDAVGAAIAELEATALARDPGIAEAVEAIEAMEAKPEPMRRALEQHRLYVERLRKAREDGKLERQTREELEQAFTVVEAQLAELRAGFDAD